MADRNALYGYGYLPDLGTDSDWSPTTQDILAKQNALGPSLRSYDEPWYRRLPNAMADLIYGENASAAQASGVRRILGTENPGRENLPVGVLRDAADAIPVNESLPPPQFFMDPRSLSAAAMGKGGLNSMANWMEGTPHVEDMIAPMGGTMLAAPKMGLRTGARAAASAAPDTVSERSSAATMRQTPLNLDSGISDILNKHGLVDAAGPRDTAAAAARTGQGEFNTDAYRGLTRPYDEAEGAKQQYQMFSRDPDVASGYTFDKDGGNVFAAKLRLGKNLELDAGGRGFDRIPGSAIPYETKRALGLSMDPSYVVSDIAKAAKRQGYDSVTVKNVIDNAMGENTKGMKTTTVDVVLNSSNIRSKYAGPRDTAAAETIRSAAIRVNGELFEATHHADAIKAIQEKFNKTFDEAVDLFDISDDYGFVTNTGRFVNRDEANAIVSEAGQFKENARRSGQVIAQDVNFVKPASRDTAAAAALPERPRWYHGTEEDFDRFGVNRTSEPDADALFFSSNPHLGSAYAGARSNANPHSWQALADADDIRAPDGGRVIPAHLDMKNPMKVTQRDWGSRDHNAELIKKAKAAGHDGIEFHFTDPGYGPNGLREAVVWTKGAVKSATTGETLFADQAKGAAVGNLINATAEGSSTRQQAKAPGAEPSESMNILKKYGLVGALGAGALAQDNQQ